MSGFRGNRLILRHRFLFLLLVSILIFRWSLYRPVSKSFVSHSNPPVIEYPVPNILLLGQFNYKVPISRVELWILVWTKFFSKIAIAGPFSKRDSEHLHPSGVNVLIGEADMGFVSPVTNLVRALLQAAPDIDAVLYLHDDGILNLTKFSQGRSRIPTDRIIGNLRHAPERTYTITIPTDGGDPIFRCSGGKYTPTINQTIFLRSLPYWGRNEVCLKQRLDMLLQNSADLMEFGTITESGLQFFFPAFTQTDFLLVPTAYTSTFAKIAEAHIRHGVFLECAFPTIVLWTLQQYQHKYLLKESSILLEEKTVMVKVCTSWENKIRGSMAMVENCLQHPDGYGMYHPIKLSRFPARNFSILLDRLQKPANEDYRS